MTPRKRVVRAKGAAPRSRDEFSYDLKATLALRAACLCSNPDCRKLTQGPSHDRVDARVNAGCAAHICAAARRGPRYDPGQTAEERRSAANGIWLCRNCGETVDDDETKYPALLLRDWKARAEAETERNLGRPPSAWGDAPLRPEPRVTWGTNETWIEMVTSADLEVPAFDLVDPSGFELAEMEMMTEAERERARAYNADLAKWKIEYGNVDAHNRECDRIAAAPLLKVKLHNAGRAPLLNAHCVVQFPAGLQVVGEEDVPERRSYPAIRSRPHLGARRADLLTALAQFAPITPRSLDFPSLTIPRVDVHEAGLDYDDGKWTGWSRKLKHNFALEFERGVRLLPPATTGEYIVDVEVHADNLPEPWNGRLVVRVQARPAPTALPLPGLRAEEA